MWVIEAVKNVILNMLFLEISKLIYHKFVKQIEHFTQWVALNKFATQAELFFG